MDKTARKEVSSRSPVIAICGNPNCGKTTVFNAITGLNQHVGNYPGVTVEKVTGQFKVDNYSDKITLVDIPGTYSLSAFSPDEDIAAGALTGWLDDDSAPDVIICMIDATNLERGLYFLLQVLEIGRPVVVALNMIDLAEGRGITIDSSALSKQLNGIPVIEVVGSRSIGIEELKQATVSALNSRLPESRLLYSKETNLLIELLQKNNVHGFESRAACLRVIFDIGGSAETKFLAQCPIEVRALLEKGRQTINSESLTLGETSPLTDKAQQLYMTTVTEEPKRKLTRSERLDRLLLHPILGPIILVGIMVFVFQSIFSWAEPFMDLLDSSFGYLASRVDLLMVDGPLKSLITDGIIGGVGSVLMFIPQIVILFLFIALLEDSGYMSRAAFLVDRMFRWCGLSGKSFIPMLSSFACAVPGVLATRTIEDRKLRLITIMVAPLMTCSARLPVYAIMIAAFIPYQTAFGLFNLQGLTLTILYLLGIVVAIMVSFILQRLVFRAERGTFLMEMPSYKLPTAKSILIRVFNRVKAFVVRAGGVIMAITVIIWALSYFPHSESVDLTVAHETEALRTSFDNDNIRIQTEIETYRQTSLEGNAGIEDEILIAFEPTGNGEEIAIAFKQLVSKYPEHSVLINAHSALVEQSLNYEASIALLANEKAGRHLRNSYFAKIGHIVAPLFAPLGWDWKITMATLAAFPAREVIIATLGTMYNLGSDVDAESSSLVDKMRESRWEDGPKAGQKVFTPAVALSIMVFFALCCQCGATLVTIKKETGTWKYPVYTFLYMTSLAYILSFVTYQIFGMAGL